MKPANLRQRIMNDWAGTTTLPVLLCIFDEFVISPELYIDSKSSLTTFNNIVRRGVNNFSYEGFSKNILKSINYLLDPHINVLSTNYEYIDESETFELTAEEILEASSDGFLVHPISGEQIFRYETDVVITFSLKPDAITEGV
ncbi:hypothetical protein AKG98_3516 [Moritella sp. JT01]|uniref:hypothetical protein n=1 Tax=Moritella sp. JT01 TaxID=756698 RepID=UPI000794BA01|nr:hypothetical protein [Moritella sp. JT01]KXO13294.1 hypothetical protein AKG98_3516 [Moritella sp. JT01]